MNENESDKPPVATRSGDDYYAGKASQRSASAISMAEQAINEARRSSAELQGLREDVNDIRVTLGHAPSPGIEGKGLVGAVAKMEDQLDRLVRAEEARAKREAPRARKKYMPTVLALVAALGGGGGIASAVHAFRSTPPPAQTSGAPPTP